MTTELHYMHSAIEDCVPRMGSSKLARISSKQFPSVDPTVADRWHCNLEIQFTCSFSLVFPWDHLGSHRKFRFGETEVGYETVSTEVFSRHRGSAFLSLGGKILL